jgi:hypothetical protein
MPALRRRKLRTDVRKRIRTPPFAARCNGCPAIPAASPPPHQQRHRTRVSPAPQTHEEEHHTHSASRARTARVTPQSTSVWKFVGVLSAVRPYTSAPRHRSTLHPRATPLSTPYLETEERRKDQRSCSPLVRRKRGRLPFCSCAVKRKAGLTRRHPPFEEMAKTWESESGRDRGRGSNHSVPTPPVTKCAPLLFCNSVDEHHLPPKMMHETAPSQCA